jgi:hypothetical protein
VTTVYDIKLNYAMGGDASGKLDGLAKQADRAASALEGLKGLLRDVGVAFGVGMLFEKGKQAFIGFNAEMEQLRINLGAVVQMNLGGTFQQAQKDAAGMFEEFQKFAMTTPLMTKDIVEFGNTISAAVLTKGGSLKDFVEITERGAVAAQVLAPGKGGAYAGVEMQHLLAGDISSRMVFINSLMASTLAKHKMTKEQFKQLGDSDRIALIKEALNNPGLRDATKGMERSFEGVWSTFKDNVQIALGKVGLPLFKELTKEISGWVALMERNKGSLESFGKQFGEAMVTAFRFGKDFITGLVEHKTLILTLAGAWGGMKMLRGGIGMASGMAGGLGDIWANLTGPAKAGASALETMTSRITGAMGVVGALALLYTTLQGITAWWDQQQKDNIGRLGELGALGATGKNSFIGRKEAMMGGMNAPVPAGILTDMEADMLVRKAKQFGAIDMLNKGGVEVPAFNAQAFRQNVMAAGMQAEQAYIAERLVEVAFAKIGSQKLVDVALGHASELSNQRAAMKKDKDINVKIEKIEVASDDPDKFAMGLVRSFREISKNPVSAEAAAVLRGGLG